MQKIIDEFGRGSLPRLPLHKNPGLELVYLQHGNVVWRCNGQTEALPPNSAYFTLPWQEHGSAFEFEPGHQWYFVVLCLRGASLQAPAPLRFPAELGLTGADAERIGRLLLEAPRHGWPATPLFALLMTTLIAELERPGPLHHLRVARLASQLVVELARQVARKPGARPPQAAAAERFAALLNELSRTCAEPWTLAEMADRMGVRRTQFEALCRHYTGDTPIRCLHRLRVGKARHLLQATNKPITDIALECGFSSSQHFASVFQRFTGITASTYRRRPLPPLSLPRAGQLARRRRRGNNPAPAPSLPSPKRKT